MSDCWEIIGVEDTADEKTVKAAYAKLIKQFRPEQYANEFRKIRKAYEEILLLIRNKTTAAQSDRDEADPHTVYVEDINSFERSSAGHETDSNDAYNALMEIYNAHETRNNPEAWHDMLEKYKFHFLENEKIALLFLDDIIKAQFFYRTEMLLDVKIYIMLIDFFNINLDEFLLNNHSSTVSIPLLEKVWAWRRSNKLSETPSAAFNQQDAYKELVAEEFLYHEILGSRNVDLRYRLRSVAEIIKQDIYTDYHVVMRRVLFRYILDIYTRSAADLDDETSALIYDLYALKNNKREFLKLFMKLGYSKHDIKNCFKYCDKVHKLKLHKKKKWPIFGVCCIIYCLIVYGRRLLN